MASSAEELTQSLHAAMDLIEERFCATGTAEAPPFALKMKGGRPFSFEPTMEGRKALCDLARKHATAGSDDVTELLAKVDFTTDLEIDAAILDKVREVLMPRATSIRAELHKLVFIEQYGSLKARPASQLVAPTCSSPGSSPSSSTCFGMLELKLAGGSFDTLQLSHGVRIVELHPGFSSQKPTEGDSDDEPQDRGDSEEEGTATAAEAAAKARTRAQPPAAQQPGAPSAPASTAEGTESERAGCSLDWAACFGDVYVEVKQAYDPRVSLVYSLHLDRRRDPGDCSGGSLLERASSLQGALHNALASPLFLPEGGKVGFYCRHPYLEAALEKAQAKLHSGGADAMSLPLKNEDAVAAVVLAASGLKLECLRLVSTDTSSGFYVLDKMPTLKDAADFGFHGRIGDVDAESYYGTCCHPDHLDRCTKGKLGDVAGPVLWLGSHKAAKRTWAKLTEVNTFNTQQFTTSCALVAKVPPFQQRQAAGAGRQKPLTVEQVQPFRTLLKRKGSNKYSEWQEASDFKRTGKKAKPEPAPVAPLTAPPILFAPQDPSLMTVAQKRAAALETVRTIHVSGGRGRICECADEGSDLHAGKASIKLRPGHGLAQLKTSIKEAFGKLPKFRIGPLLLLDAEGRSSSVAAKPEDLLDGVCVQCTYIAAEGSF